jgi:hypothetical protein
MKERACPHFLPTMKKIDECGGGGNMTAALYSSHKQLTLKLKSKIPQRFITILEKQEQEEEKEYDAESPLLSKYDEFAAAVVATENKKRSEQKLKRLIN